MFVRKSSLIVGFGNLGPLEALITLKNAFKKFLAERYDIRDLICRNEEAVCESVLNHYLSNSNIPKAATVTHGPSLES